jgi:hypothetical protein
MHSADIYAGFVVASANVLNKAQYDPAAVSVVIERLPMRLRQSGRIIGWSVPGD